MPISSAATAGFGGNTSCVEVRCNGRTLILDAGTGLAALGQTRTLQDADILLSHTHLDHIIGFPFFAPLYNPKAQIRVWAGHLMPEYNLRQTLTQLMSPPLFPFSLDALKASMEYHDFEAGSPLSNKDLTQAEIVIQTLRLHHPDRATGYRIEYKNKSVCYLTDVEHIPGILDAEIVNFIQGTDMLIYDSNYDDAEFAAHQGWGHSTWQHACRLGQAAGVDKIAIFHHDMHARDDVLRARALSAASLYPGAFWTRDGMEVTL